MSVEHSTVVLAAAAYTCPLLDRPVCSWRPLRTKAILTGGLRVAP